MRKRIERIVSVLILIAIIIVSISKVSALLRLKESDNRYASFFAEENRIDVLFLGASHVSHVIFPMELWNDYGITSYNLAGDGNAIPTSYWILVNALDYQMPKVVVMDVYDLLPDRKFSDAWGMVHESLDAFPLSVNKFRMVMDLIDDENVTDENGILVYGKRWELLFDLSEYHSRWNSLEEGDLYSRSELESNSASWRGQEPYIGFEQRKEPVYTENDNLHYDELAKDYLERMIQLCADKNIDLVLINTGYDSSGETKYFADSINEIAKQHEIQYIDFTELDIINFESDLASSGDNTHVNFSGAEKITTYLGQLLAEQYQMSDHRGDEAYVSWWYDYQHFIDRKADYLRGQINLDLYLMLLADDDYNIIIETRDMNIVDESNNYAMFENLGIDMDQYINNSNLLAIDMSSGEISYLNNSYESGLSLKSVLGEISLQGYEGTYGMYLDGEEMYVANLGDWSRIKITVISRDSGEVVDVRDF